MSTEVILSILILLKYEKPFDEIVSNSELKRQLNKINYNDLKICECMIVITIELMKLYTRGGSSSQANEKFKKYVVDIKYMAKGISVKDDILDFEIGNKMTREVEVILRRPLVSMDVQDVSLSEVDNRNSKLMQEEICKLIFDKLKENMQKLSRN